MSIKAWERYYQYGCVSLSQNRFGEASREFGKAVRQAKNAADDKGLAQAQAKLKQVADFLTAERFAASGTQQMPAYALSGREAGASSKAPARTFDIEKEPTYTQTALAHHVQTTINHV
jgi:hypothetical protein